MRPLLFLLTAILASAAVAGCAQGPEENLDGQEGAPRDGDGNDGDSANEGRASADEIEETVGEEPTTLPRQD